MTQNRRPVWATALVCAGALAACSDDGQSTIEPAPEIIKALWDPTNQILPSPNDILRSPTTGRLDLPIGEDLPPAEKQFRAWLNSLDGYPVTSTVAIPMSGPVDTTTLRPNFILAPRAGGPRLDADVTYDPLTGAVVATPLEPLQPGTTYVYGLRGYEGGAIGATGEQVVGDAAFAWIRGEEVLTEHAGAIPGETAEAREAAAATLEAVRLSAQPIHQRLSAFGTAVESLASAGQFSVSGRPSIWFDPTSGQIPLPNDLLLDPQTGLVTLPADPEDNDEAKKIKAALAKYDGFGISAPIVMRASAPVDPATVRDPANIRVFRVDGDDVFEFTDLERGVLDDGHTFWVRPRLSFEDRALYVVCVTRAVTSDDTALEAQPTGALLRLRSPLVLDGVSQVSSLDDASAALLEPARRKTQAALEALEQEGVPRTDISLALPFTTASAAHTLLERRASLTLNDAPTTIVNAIGRSPLERGLLLAMPSVRTVVTGQITTHDYLDPLTRRNRKDGSYEERLIDFVLTIPRSAEPGTPTPTVIFGHGLSTSRELVYLIAQTLAAAGYAAITVDLPYHGERSVCVKDDDCAGGQFTCNPEGVCTNGSGDVGELVRVSSPFPDGPTYPISSGVTFIQLDDIVATRDHFTQALLDLNQLVRVVQNESFSGVSGGYTLDGDDLVYLGMSLGGILGANLAVVEPEIGTYVLNVPGGSFFDMMETSAAFSTLFDEALAERGITAREGDAYFEFESTIRWVVDPVDPLNVAHHALRDPITWTDPVDGQQRTTPLKRVLVQMAKDDSVVPNTATRLLSERMQLPFVEYTPLISNHAFLFDPTSLEGRRAREDMIQFFDQRP